MSNFKLFLFTKPNFEWILHQKGALFDLNETCFLYTFSQSFMPPIHFRRNTFLNLIQFLGCSGGFWAKGFWLMAFRLRLLANLGQKIHNSEEGEIDFAKICDRDLGITWAMNYLIALGYSLYIRWRVIDQSEYNHCSLETELSSKSYYA